MVDIMGTGMGLPVWVWLVAILIAAFVIVFVWMILHFIWPMKNSFARHVVKAKRDGKPVIFLDNGKFFRCVIGENKVGEEKAQIIRSGSDVIKAGSVGGMKYCEGLLMGVGEDFRSMVANVAIIDLMEMLKRKDWNQEEVDKLLKDLHENLRIELGYVDGAKILKDKYEDKVAEINTRYDKAIQRAIGYPPAGPGQVPETDNSKEEGEEDGQGNEKED